MYFSISTRNFECGSLWFPKKVGTGTSILSYFSIMYIWICLPVMSCSITSVIFLISVSLFARSMIKSIPFVFTSCRNSSFYFSSMATFNFRLFLFPFSSLIEATIFCWYFSSSSRRFDTSAIFVVPSVETVKAVSRSC